jgi:hypothetical protein
VVAVFIAPNMGPLSLPLALVLMQTVVRALKPIKQVYLEPAFAYSPNEKNTPTPIL